MVLIFGEKSDPCVTQTLSALKCRGAEVAFLEEDRLLEDLGVSWASTGEPEDSYLVVDCRKVRFSEITGVLARSWNAVSSDPALSDRDRDYIRFEMLAAVTGILANLPCPVVNRPVMGRAYSPIFSDRDTYNSILEAGFQAPESFVTSNADTAQRYYNQAGQKAVLGSPANQIPRQYIAGEEGETRLREAADHPIYLQSVPPGDPVHVFTVGDKVFAAEAPWLAGSDPLRQVEINPDLSGMCVDLARRLQLEFAQFLIVRGDAGRAYCLDVSIYPRFWVCEDALQEALVQSLVDRLTIAS